jgi:DNA processing protein
MIEGTLDFNSRPILGIVGTRDSSIMAEAWMKRVLPDVVRGVVTVSGGARGIDEMAHEIAVREKQATAVILPSSLDRPYPPDWIDRKARVLANGGCFISEYPAGTDIRRWHFEKRNRLIAALSDVVLVVEARRRSGTSITARHATRMGRSVATIPWFPSDPRGELCKDLLANGGAVMVRDAADLLALLSRASDARATRMFRRLDS